MKSHFFESLLFAAAMTAKDYYDEKIAEQEEEKRFNERRIELSYTILTKEIQKISTIIESALEEQHFVIMPSEILLGVKYLPLYCFSFVIKEQGAISTKQKNYLNNYFKRVDLPFSLDEYYKAALSDKEIGDLRKVCFHTENDMGTFWKHYYRLSYVTSPELHEYDLRDSLDEIVSAFANLNDSIPPDSLDLFDHFKNVVHYDNEILNDFSGGEVDWFGVISMEERISRIREHMECLLHNNDFLEADEQTDMTTYLEWAVLKSIYDIVNETDLPQDSKLSIIEEIVCTIDLKFDFTIEGFCECIETQNKEGKYLDELLRIDSPMGVFWQTLFVISWKSGKHDALTNMLDNLWQMLLQVENYILNEYDYHANSSLAQAYTTKLLDNITNIYPIK